MNRLAAAPAPRAITLAAALAGTRADLLAAREAECVAAGIPAAYAAARADS